MQRGVCKRVRARCGLSRFQGAPAHRSTRSEQLLSTLRHACQRLPRPRALAVPRSPDQSGRPGWLGPGPRPRRYVAAAAGRRSDHRRRRARPSPGARGERRPAGRRLVAGRAPHRHHAAPRPPRATRRRARRGWAALPHERRAAQHHGALPHQRRHGGHLWASAPPPASQPPPRVQGDCDEPPPATLSDAAAPLQSRKPRQCVLAVARGLFVLASVAEHRVALERLHLVAAAGGGGVPDPFNLVTVAGSRTHVYFLNVTLQRAAGPVQARGLAIGDGAALYCGGAHTRPPDST